MQHTHMINLLRKLIGIYSKTEFEILFESLKQI